MRILQCHNYYTLRAGECAVFDMHVRLLREAGHEVTVFTCDNADAPVDGAGERLGTGLRAIHSRQTVRDLRALLARASFDVAHVHNTWLRMSPSVYGCLSRHGVPVVTTLHNFRWLCPAATLYRDGRPCHDCVERPGGALHAVAHRCFRRSVLASGVAALVTVVNRDLLRVFRRHVDVIAVQNSFVERLFIGHGFPGELMAVVGTTADVHAAPGSAAESGDTIVFAGRLDPTKGVGTLMAAAQLGEFRLRIFGAGPLRAWLERTVAERFPDGGRVTYGGHVDRAAVMRAVAGCAAVVVPSEWYESFPGIIVEAMAHGRPVIASDLGALGEIVRDGENGIRFPAGDAAALAAAAARLLADEPLRRRLGRGALATYEAEMTPARLAARLTAAYERAITRRSARRRR